MAATRSGVISSSGSARCGHTIYGNSVRKSVRTPAATRGPPPSPDTASPIRTRSVSAAPMSPPC